MTRAHLPSILLLVVLGAARGAHADEHPPLIRVGSKNFTESAILGEMIRLLVEDAGQPATHLSELGGTRLVFEALRNGDVDVYPEYTGTIAEEILSESKPESQEAMRSELASQGIVMSKPIGFNNTYAIAMLRPRAEELREDLAG